MTFNEPRVVAALGYDTAFFAAGRCSKEYGSCLLEFQDLSLTWLHILLILSHAAAV